MGEGRVWRGGRGVKGVGEGVGGGVRWVGEGLKREAG